MNFNQQYIVTVLFAMLFVPAMLFSQNFEGKMVERDVTFFQDGFRGLDWMDQAAVADQLFSKSVDELIKMAGSDNYEMDKATIYFKGGKYRVESESEGEKVVMIYNMDNQQVITLQPAQKMAMITSMDEIGNTMNQMMGQLDEMMGEESSDEEMSGESDQFSMEAAGQKKTINGFSCELYKGRDDEGNYTHIWLEKGNADLWNSFKTFVTSMTQMNAEGEDSDSEEKFFMENKGIPILTQTVTMDELEVHETVSLKEESVPDNYFEIPDGYQKLNMKEMMQQQMQMMQEQMKQK